ncbi:11501_t:CDS:2 [Funneliformis mosseae]|uniref:11501_t:CDS:1 n=1 Tax=Funneliformis mosseae TaxID=27381 RepID=A0A9N8ZMD2_FUNMO|nr:11501_t:CDS:2 [Funneliformis mosseae]
MLFLSGWKMEWHDFEILVAKHIAFHIKTLFYLRYKKMAFKNIFWDAYNDKISLETKVELKKITIHQLCNKFSVTYPITNKQGEIVNFKLGVIVNENKASFADFFLVFKGYFEKADVKKEHNKNVAAVQSTHYNFGINNYNVITVFISSADLKEDISGYCEEPLPNYRWLSVSTKIPQEIIDRVRAKRPLCSSQDMFNADPWFNNYKDDINNMTYSLYTDAIDLANSNKKRQLSYYDEVLQL